MTLVTDLNRDVPPARPGEFDPLAIGPLRFATPVVLAPMAGVTTAPYRVLCRRFGEALYVGEMTAARGLCLGNRRTLALARFLPEEQPRSLQLYGTTAEHLAEAARIVIGQLGVEHIDLNLGCPVRKITRSGGGSAIPVKPRLMARLVRALVSAAAPVPVTVKMRLGLSDELLTYCVAGRVAEDEGAAAVGLHARTAAQLYAGEARWEAIGELQAALSIPVLGNGDIFEAQDALRMMRATGCGGVIIGRGSLGRPWLFRDLEAVFRGRLPEAPPCFGEVRRVAIEHAELLVDFFGPVAGMRQMRKHATWYTKSFRHGSKLRAALCRVTSIEELAAALGAIPDDTPFPVEGLRVKRCKSGGTQRVTLPEGYLEGG